MQRISFWLVLMFLSTSFLFSEITYNVASPNKKLSFSFWISTNAQAYYRVTFFGDTLLQLSKLGVIRDDEDFSNNLQLDSVSNPEFITDEYKIFQRNCFYDGTRRIFHLKNLSNKKMDVLVQVSNDGVAFRYSFPDSSKGIRHIQKEISSFHFFPGTTTWIQPMAEAKSGWCQVNPCYEENYRQNIDVEKLNSNNAGWVFPALFHYKQYWMLITETAPNRNYCGCRLQHDSASNEFFIGFPDKRENYPGGPVYPESTLPWSTPWRIIAIGNGLRSIVESTLGTDLAEPNILQDISFVKPGRASWSWPLLKDDSTIYEVQKRFIDYAAEMKWEYCLIDANWDTQIGYERMKQLADYARVKNVGILLWYNSSGDWNATTLHPKSKLLTHESRIQEFTRLKEMGIQEIKVDFFGGDGQSMMSYYQDILEDAAHYGLMVNCHGSTIPRGWHRTYPNLISMEGVRGFEYITFDQTNAEQEANHCCVLPFTRNVFDPMDFTPMCFSEVPNIKRTTTNGFELALSVIFWSGIQHYAEIPEGMAKVPDYVRSFLRELPPQWEETRFIDGFPGKFIVLARRSGNTWYIAGINGEPIEQHLQIELPFLVKETTGQMIFNGDDNRSFTTKSMKINLSEPLKVTLKPNGGFVLKSTY